YQFHTPFSQLHCAGKRAISPDDEKAVDAKCIDRILTGLQHLGVDLPGFSVTDLGGKASSIGCAQDRPAEILNVNGLFMAEFNIVAVDEAFPASFEANESVPGPNARDNGRCDDGVDTGTITTTIDDADRLAV